MKLTEIMQVKGGESIVYEVVDFSDTAAIESYAKKLEGMTFQEVIDLNIAPDGVSRDYGSKRYKGGLGTLIEERYFGYKANSDAAADFSDASLELKTTCLDIKRDGSFSAGERLVLTMIPFDMPIEDNFSDSHLWEKSKKILLVYYLRDKTIDSFEQKIEYVSLFSPPDADLRIIVEDYEIIRDIIKSGKAENLSESLTNYLGACTKGATAATMLVNQYYSPYTQAKKRAFCFKRQYMDYVFHHYILGERSEAEAIIDEAFILGEETFEEFVLGKISPHIGKTARELCETFKIKYTRSKAQWTTLTYLMLGVRGENAEEFQKANISVRTVRLRKTGGIKESLSLNPFKFMEIVAEEWESSALCLYLEETKFFFTAFRVAGDDEVLVGSTFWCMPAKDLEGLVHKCWSDTKKTVSEGVLLNRVLNTKGEMRVVNNLPKIKDNPIAHVRPHASKRAYFFLDGMTIGNPDTDAFELPDGQKMTKQSFWLNSSYIYAIIRDSGLGDLD